MTPPIFGRRSVILDDKMKDERKMPPPTITATPHHHHHPGLSCSRTFLPLLSSPTLWTLCRNFLVCEMETYSPFILIKSPL